MISNIFIVITLPQMNIKNACYMSLFCFFLLLLVVVVGIGILRIAFLLLLSNHICCSSKKCVCLRPTNNSNGNETMVFSL